MIQLVISRPTVPPSKPSTRLGSGSSSMRTSSPRMRAPVATVAAPTVCLRKLRRGVYPSSVWKTARRTLARLPATLEPPLVDLERHALHLRRGGLQDRVPDGARAQVAADAALRVVVPALEALAAGEEARLRAAGGDLQGAAGPADEQPEGLRLGRLSAAPLAAHVAPAARDAVQRGDRRHVAADLVAGHPQADVPARHPVRLEAELEVRPVRRRLRGDAPQHRAAVA